MSVVMSFRLSAWKNAVPTGRIFMKSDIWGFFENLLRKFKLHHNLTTITGTVHEDRHTFLITSRSVLLIMRNVSNSSWRGNQNTHFVLCDFFFKNRVVCEIMWESIVDRSRPQMTIWRVRVACWITHRMCNTFGFSTAAVVTRTLLNVTSYTHCKIWRDK